MDVYDCILVETDIAFNLVLETLSELQRNQLLHLRTSRTVMIDNIESNNSSDYHCFRFGGEHAGSFIKRTQAFAKTASSVLRMCMLVSANASHFCPGFGQKSHSRNKAKMQVTHYGQQFELSNNRMLTMEYYGCYDQIYPHFKIEHLLTTQPHERILTPAKIMLIFRRNFSEVIQITTNLEVQDMSDVYGPGIFRSFVHVLCSVYNVGDPEHHSMQPLKALKYDAREILLTYQQNLGIPLQNRVPFAPEPSEESFGESDSEEEEEIDEVWDTRNLIETNTAPPNLFELPKKNPVMERLNVHFTGLHVNKK